MSKLTENFLHGLDYEAICKKRTENFEYLHSRFSISNRLKLNVPEGAFMRSVEKGLSEVICKYIFREFPARVEIPLTESVTDEMKALYKETEKPHSEYVQRKSLCQLVYKKLEDIGTITVKQYQEVLKKYPLLSELYALTKDFYSVIFSKNPAKLDDWINTAQKYDISELQTFLNGVKKDLEDSIITKFLRPMVKGRIACSA